MQRWASEWVQLLGPALPVWPQRAFLTGRCGHVFSTWLECIVQTTVLSCLCHDPPEDELLYTLRSRKESWPDINMFLLFLSLFSFSWNSVPLGSYSPSHRDSTTLSLQWCTWAFLIAAPASPLTLVGSGWGAELFQLGCVLLKKTPSLPKAVNAFNKDTCFSFVFQKRTTFGGEGGPGTDTNV